MFLNMLIIVLKVNINNFLKEIFDENDTFNMVEIVYYHFSIASE